MKTIWKFDIPIEGTWINLPVGGEIVHTECQYKDNSGVVSIWVLLTDPKNTQYEARLFQVFGTGNPIPENAKYIGTAMTAEGALVWHVMEIFDNGG